SRAAGEVEIARNTVWKQVGNQPVENGALPAVQERIERLRRDLSVVAVAFAEMRVPGIDGRGDLSAHSGTTRLRARSTAVSRSDDAATTRNSGAIASRNRGAP